MENTTAPHVQKNSSVVAFKLDQRTFALPLETIVQILPMMTITPIPHLSKIVKGTVNIRGEDVLVINLRNHFNLEETDLQLYTPLLLLKLRNRMLVLIVDAVLDVMNLPIETLTGMQAMLPEGIDNLPLLQGVSYYNNDTILVLDPDNLFYNHHTLVQSTIESKTSAPAETPVKKEPSIADALVAIAAKAPAAEIKPAAEAPIAETAPATETKPAEQKKTMAAAKKAPAAKGAPDAGEKPAKDVPADPTSNPPAQENK